MDVLTTRPVVDTPLSFSNIAPGNYTTVTLPGGQVFDGVSYANGTTTAQAFTNDGSTINPSGNGFGVANNLINDNEGFLFSNHDSSSLSFDVNFQPNTSTVTVSWATYAGGTPTAGALPLQTGTFLVTKDADGITHVDIDPTLDFDHMVVRFDYSESGNPAARVENFSVTQQVIPDDQVLQFAVTVKDADGDIVTSTTPTTTIDVTFQGGAPVPPVAIDLDGDGLEFVDRSLGVTHDYGSGTVSTAWVSSDDGLLAHAIGGSYDIVFADDAPGAKSDLEGLRLAYDGNGDAVFDAHDAAYSEFGVWQDLNSNSVVDGGEFKSLADMGIASIKLTSDGQSYQAAGGDVTVLGEATFNRTDGTTGTVGDVVFATSKDVDLAKTESTTSGFNQALIAASLVAVAGTVETLEQAPARSSLRPRRRWIPHRRLQLARRPSLPTKATQAHRCRAKARIAMVRISRSSRRATAAATIRLQIIQRFRAAMMHRFMPPMMMAKRSPRWTIIRVCSPRRSISRSSTAMRQRSLRRMRRLRMLKQHRW